MAWTSDVVEERPGLRGWFGRNQGWFFFPLLTLEGMSLHLSSVRALTAKGPVANRAVDLTIVVSRLVLYVAILLLLLPPGKAVAFFFVQMALFGVFLGGSFAPNHKGMPIIPAGMKVDFLRRQVLTSRNVRGGVAVDFAMGGLNYQVEHHLFPSMPRPNLKHVQPVVREYCERSGREVHRGGLLRVVPDHREVPQQRRPRRPRRVRLPGLGTVRTLTRYRQERSCFVIATAAPSWSTYEVPLDAATDAGTCSSTAGVRP